MKKDNSIKRKGFGFYFARLFSYIIMGLFSLMTIYPIIWMIINSFKSKQEYMMNRLGLPISITFANFNKAWTLGEFDKLIFNSILYTVATTLGIIVLSFMAGFAFAKIPSKATKPIYGSFLIGILLTIQSIMVPLFIMMNTVGLYNSRIGVIIAYIGVGLPMGIYLGTEYI